MSGGLFNSPPGTPMARAGRSAFAEGRESVLELLRDPDDAMAALVAEWFGVKDRDVAGEFFLALAEDLDGREA